MAMICNVVAKEEASLRKSLSIIVLFSKLDPRVCNFTTYLRTEEVQMHPPEKHTFAKLFIWSAELIVLQNYSEARGILKSFLFSNEVW